MPILLLMCLLKLKSKGCGLALQAAYATSVALCVRQSRRSA